MAKHINLFNLPSVQKGWIYMAMLSTNMDNFTDNHVDLMIQKGMFQKEQKESLKKGILDFAQFFIKRKYDFLFGENDADENTKETLEACEKAFNMIFPKNKIIDLEFLGTMATEKEIFRSHQ